MNPQVGFPGGSESTSSANAGDWVQSLGGEDPLEKGMATHSSILAWKIPLVSLGNNNYRVRHGVGKGFVNELAFELDLEG